MVHIEAYCDVYFVRNVPFCVTKWMLCYPTWSSLFIHAINKCIAYWAASHIRDLTVYMYIFKYITLSAGGLAPLRAMTSAREIMAKCEFIMQVFVHDLKGLCSVFIHSIYQELWNLSSWSFTDTGRIRLCYYDVMASRHSLYYCPFVWKSIAQATHIEYTLSLLNLPALDCMYIKIIIEACPFERSAFHTICAICWNM